MKAKYCEASDDCEPSSDGFPEGLLAQPLYGWLRGVTDLAARFNELIRLASATG